MKYRELLTWTFLLLGIIMAWIPLIYWFANPHLTGMQMFLKFWWVHLILAISAFSIFYIEEKNDITF